MSDDQRSGPWAGEAGLVNVYEVTFDTAVWVVEATSFGEAVQRWRASALAKWRADGEYEDGDEGREPDQVLVRNDVVRLVPA